MLTILYTYRNRELGRIKRSLDSLTRQTNRNFKVVFVDYGSDIIISKKVRKLISNYEFVLYSYNFSEYQPWSRAKAINIGLKKITTDYVFTADIDMIFSPDFIAKLYELKNPEKIFYFKVGFLNRKESQKDTTFENYSVDFSTGSGAQGLSFFPLNAIEMVKGYDEFYHFWGAEDVDIHNRLKGIGFESVFYDNEILLLHQWHKNYRNNESNILETELKLSGIIEINHEHLVYNLKNRIISANSKEWGKVISETEFNELENCDKEIVLINRVEIINHFLFVELPQFQNGILSLRFVQDDFQYSLKYKMKRIVGKKVPQYYSLKEINDKLLLHIVSFYHQYVYSFKIADDLKSISFKIKKD